MRKEDRDAAEEACLFSHPSGHHCAQCDQIVTVVANASREGYKRGKRRALREAVAVARRGSAERVYYNLRALAKDASK